MIETVVLDYLRSKLDVPVLMELPEVPSEDFLEWPESFVVIERVGMSKSDHVKCVSLAFQSTSTTRLFDAAALNETVMEAVEDMAELPDVGSVYLSSNYNHTDHRTNRYRYQCVYDVYYV